MFLKTNWCAFSGLIFITLALSGCGSSSSGRDVSNDFGENDTANYIQCSAVDSAEAGVIVSAHRGGAAYAPENTLVAFANGARLGVDQLELDIQLTADNEIVVIHDDTLDRTTNCSGPIIEKTLTEVQECHAAYWFSPGQSVTSPDDGANHPLRGLDVQVPTLKAVLDWYVTRSCPRPDLSIEIKNIPGEGNFDPVGDKVAKILLPMLESYGVTDETIIQSFWPQTLTAVKSMNPNQRTQFLTNSAAGLVETAAENLSFSFKTGQDVVSPNWNAPGLDPFFVFSAQFVKKLVIPYTPDKVSHQQSMLDLGVDGVITNFPACTLQLLNRPVPTSITPDGVPEVPACP